MKRTDPAWPTTWFSPVLTGRGSFKNVYSIMNNWGANHGAISYGHIGADLITFASMFRIPVNMHNVPLIECSVPKYGVHSAIMTPMVLITRRVLISVHCMGKRCNS